MPLIQLLLCECICEKGCPQVVHYSEVPPYYVCLWSLEMTACCHICRFECVQCHSAFSSQAKLTSHSESHSTQKSFKCTVQVRSYVIVYVHALRNVVWNLICRGSHLHPLQICTQKKYTTVLFWAVTRYWYYTIHECVYCVTRMCVLRYTNVCTALHLHIYVMCYTHNTP